jgi:hypothetical protein
MRILITGSRDYTDYDTISRGMVVAIETLIAKFPDDMTITFVHGAAPGADTLADRFAKSARKFLMSKGYQVDIEPHPADWPSFGKGAGPKRNKEMVDLGADICIAFFSHPDSKGTRGCVSLAKAAGIEVLEYH